MELLWWCDDDEAGSGSSDSHFLQFILKIVKNQFDNFTNTCLAFLSILNFLRILKAKIILL